MKRYTVTFLSLIIIFGLILIGCSNTSSKVADDTSGNFEQIIDEKLDSIINQQDTKVQISSNPYDYIKSKNANEAYNYIVSQSEKALKYMLEKFASSTSNGLEEYIMAIACSEILKEDQTDKNWASGREWYNKYINNANAKLNFKFDSNGNYLGFVNLPENYTADQAEKDGCYVRNGMEAVGGEEKWNDFVRDALCEKNTSIRIVSIFDSEIYFQDLVYFDGFYRVFNSNSDDLQDYKYKYLLTLEGITNGKRGTVTVLSDDNTLTYNKYTRTMLSSNFKDFEAISPVKLLFFGNYDDASIKNKELSDD